MKLKRVSYSLAISCSWVYDYELNVCLCVWNISLLLLTCFYSWVLQLTTHVFDVLVVSLCKPAIRKLKISGQGKLKSIGGITKRGDQILKFQWGDKRREHDFWLKFSGGEGGGILEETMHSCDKQISINHSRVPDLFLDLQKTLETRILEQSVQIS